MSSLTRFPDVALPLPPRPIDAYVECTFVTNIFSLYEKIFGSDDREDTASRWHSSRRPSNALNDLCKGLSDSVVLSSEVAGWMTSKPKASLGEGIGLWSENARRDGSVDKKKLRTYFYPIHVRGIDVHTDKALLWSPGRSSHFWNIQTPPNLKKTSAISRAGCDFIALRTKHPPISMRDREHVADLGRLP
ncbi:hypothetical protein EV363DRAFT_1332554 [Boletus edulis]|nr:hypothetical protein EV363DRAFT_1332554 [Boletus edulis]